MLTILRVRGASYRDNYAQGEARSCFTNCVSTCPWLTSITREETTSVVMIWRLQPDALPCHIFSTLFRLASVFLCTARSMWAKFIINDRVKADSDSHRSTRCLWNADCLSDHCSPTYRIATPEHQ